MWTPEAIAATIAAVFAGLNTLIAGASAILIIYFNERRARQTYELGKAIDGRMEELLDQKGKASAAEGELKGRSEIKAEIKAEKDATN